jgi:hypothetical protein
MPKKRVIKRLCKTARVVVSYNVCVCGGGWGWGGGGGGGGRGNQLPKLICVTHVKNCQPRMEAAPNTWSIWLTYESMTMKKNCCRLRAVKKVIVGCELLKS